MEGKQRNKLSMFNLPNSAALLSIEHSGNTRSDVTLTLGKSRFTKSRVSFRWPVTGLRSDQMFGHVRLGVVVCRGYESDCPQIVAGEIKCC